MDVFEAQAKWDELVDRVKGTQERVILTSNGSEVAAIIPIDDLKLLEKIEDHLDIKLARQILGEAREKIIPFDEVLKKLSL